MAKNKPTKLQAGKTINDQGAKKTLTVKRDLLDSIDAYFQKHSKLFLFLSLGISVLFAALLFDVKVGIAGDDSAYIQRTYNLIHKGAYPGFQGPMYPFVLSPFIAIFGINLPILKFLSLIFLVASIYFTYKAFSGKFPQSVVTISVILLSFNYFLLYFASQTYSEAFFLMVQSLFFWYFSKKFFNEGLTSQKFQNFLILGFLLFLMILTKNVAYAALAAIIGFFVLNKQWKYTIQIILSFFIFFVLFEIIKRLFWGNAQLQFASQGSGLLYKNYYNPSEGYETFAGFINRFFQNSGLYFSKHLFTFLGFRKDATTVSTTLTVLAWIGLIGASVISFRRNKLMFFTAIYTIAMCVVTFLILQTKWDQWRIIIIEFPLILLLFLGTLYYTSKNKKLSALQIALPVLAIIIFIKSFSGFTVDKVKVQKEILLKNLSGNLLYGLSPDQINYIEMSKWAAKNTPKEFLTGVRKQDISFIYAGREFYGINKVPSVTADSLLKLMPDTSVNVGIKLNPLMNSPLFGNAMLRQKITGVVNGQFSFGDNVVEDGTLVGVYTFSKTEFSLWEQSLKLAGIYYDVNMKDWVSNLRTASTDYAIYLPDMLLDQLKKSNVRYILLGSLRINPNQYTGTIINTLHRFTFVIQTKYPEIIRPIHKIGDVEEAELLEILY